MDKKTSVTNFSEINSPQDLITYLSDSVNRLENTKNKSIQYVYHYTKLPRACLKNKYCTNRW